jgi:aromatic ring-opening dioxygenase catalytic subunit (LigB family)
VLAVEALRLMEERKITSVIVVDRHWTRRRVLCTCTTSGAREMI